MRFNSKRKKRGSVFLTVFFVILLLSLFYLVGLGTKKNSNHIKKFEESNLGSLGEMAKDFSQMAIRNSILRGSFLSGLNGAGAVNDYWMSYSATSSPSLDEAKADLSMRSSQQCNNYLSNLQKTRIAGVTVTKPGLIEDVDILVTNSLFTNLSYFNSVSDKFYVKTQGEPTEIKSLIDANKRIIPNDFTEKISPIRYWYLYSKIKKWADSEILTTNTCEDEEVVQGLAGFVCKGPAVGKKSIDKIMKSAIKNLTDSLNEEGNYVSCTYTIPCKYAKTDFICCCNQEKCPSSHVVPGGTDCFVVKPTCSVNCKILNPFECHPVCPGFSVKRVCLSNESFCTSGSCNSNPLKFTGNNDQVSIEDIDYLPFKDQSKNPKECKEPEPRCSKVTVKYDPMNPRTQYYVPDPCGHYCFAKYGHPCHGFGENHTIEFVANVVCKDKKYLLPVSKIKPQPLVFRFKVHVYLDHWVPPPPPPDVSCNVQPVECPPKPECHCHDNPKPKPNPSPSPNPNPTPSPPSSPPPPPPPTGGTGGYGG